MRGLPPALLGLGIGGWGLGTMCIISAASTGLVPMPILKIENRELRMKNDLFNMVLGIGAAPAPARPSSFSAQETEAERRPCEAFLRARGKVARVA